jgi:hypothetical protein
VDLAKTAIQVHGIDRQGKAVLKKQLPRRRFVEFFANLRPCLVGMEACNSAHKAGPGAPYVHGVQSDGTTSPEAELLTVNSRDPRTGEPTHFRKRHRHPENRLSTAALPGLGARWALAAFVAQRGQSYAEKEERSGYRHAGGGDVDGDRRLQDSRRAFADEGQARDERIGVDRVGTDEDAVVICDQRIRPQQTVITPKDEVI